MEAPRHDTRGIVDPAALLSRVRFRRHEPAEPLRRYVEWYWLIDWDLPAPYASHIVPHPSVNLTFQWDGADEEQAPPYGEVTGVALGLYARKLTGRGRVCGAKFRPGGFRPYAPEVPVSRWTGVALPAQEVFPQATRDAARSVVTPADDHARVAALDAFLLALPCEPDPQADLAMDLVRRIRADRTVRRVGDFAHAQGLSVRALQRLFSTYVGVSPKWVILRYRIHEALEHAGTHSDIDWATLATELGYADQAHLVRDFTATVGVPPAAYAAEAGAGG
ncbi:AraC family transcriptional regulator [Streptomyces viridochromogenes]|uniref:AraC family transcriptional regulator n=1 Tax=Streptomyces viridochromogenes TaxID=1938 RepID=A0A0J7YWS4_STRVR|nr:helix-turn-helix domain-containing protein [Streptomyces viridochromogenes]KMS67927.1 AraC family transcriptional regulator [Streptomyces viridochromogenes]